MLTSYEKSFDLAAGFVYSVRMRMYGVNKHTDVYGPMLDLCSNVRKIGSIEYSRKRSIDIYLADRTPVAYPIVTTVCHVVKSVRPIMVFSVADMNYIANRWNDMYKFVLMAIGHELYHYYQFLHGAKLTMEYHESDADSKMLAELGLGREDYLWLTDILEESVIHFAEIPTDDEHRRMLVSQVFSKRKTRVLNDIGHEKITESHLSSIIAATELVMGEFKKIGD